MKKSFCSFFLLWNQEQLSFCYNETMKKEQVFDVRTKVVDGLFGKKEVKLSLNDQEREIHRLLKKYPHAKFISDLPKEDWLDELLFFDDIFEDD